MGRIDVGILWGLEAWSEGKPGLLKALGWLHVSTEQLAETRAMAGGPPLEDTHWASSNAATHYP